MTKVKEKQVTDSPKTEEDLDMQQLIVFRLGAENYAIRIDQIKEVVLTPSVTKMPRTPDYVKGVANIRGNIIAIIDLEEKFGIRRQTSGDSGQEGGNYTLVVESEDLKAGVLVTDVPNTLNLASSSIEDATGILSESREEDSFIEGVVKMDDQLILLIDIFQVLSDQTLESVVSGE